MPTSITEKVLVKHYGKQDLRFFEEENEPVNPKLWAKAKSLAEEKFETYPSYEANNWTLRWYESKGGEWWITEEGLRDWFGKSKSKDGKSGWVNVVTGGTCASDKPGEGTPKCVSSSKRASMSKAERLSAQRRKKAADPGQQQKSGAAKPTYVPTDKKKAVKEESVAMSPERLRLERQKTQIDKKIATTRQRNLAKASASENETKTMGEEADKKSKSSGTKDACYHKVKARYRVWPSAYASGALVKCRKKGADNWGNSSKKEGYEWLTVEEFAVEACWAGYEKKGMKTMFGKRYPNCVKKTKKEEVELVFTEEERRHLSRLQLKMAKRMHEMDPKKKRAVADRLKKMKVVESLDESMRLPMEFGNVYEISLNWRGMFKMAKIFFPTIKKPSKKDVTAAIQKIWPGSSVYRYVLSTVNRGDSYLVAPDPKSRVYAEFGEEITDEAYKPFPKEKVEKRIKKAKDEGREIDAHSMKTAKNMVTKADHWSTHMSDAADKKRADHERGARVYGDMLKRAKTPKDRINAMVNRRESEAKAKALKTAKNVGRGFDVSEETVSEESKRELQNKASRGDRAAMQKLKDLRAAGKIGKEYGFEPGAKKDIPDMKKIMGIEAKEEFIPEDDMKGMSVKSGHKRSVDQGAGLTKKGVEAYRRRNPGSKLKTAVTTPPSKLKPGSKAAGRRKSFCARSRGWTGERGKAARRRWNC